jgi:hypothetical protein
MTRCNSNVGVGLLIRHQPARRLYCELRISVTWPVCERCAGQRSARKRKSIENNRRERTPITREKPASEPFASGTHPAHKMGIRKRVSPDFLNTSIDQQISVGFSNHPAEVPRSDDPSLLRTEII